MDAKATHRAKSDGFETEQMRKPVKTSHWAFTPKDPKTEREREMEISLTS